MKNYNPKQVVCTIGGNVIRGFGKTAMVKSKFLNDAFTDEVGVDSEVSRSLSGDERGELEITLMQTSDSNDILGALHELDKSSPNGAGVFAYQLEDLQGRFLESAEECWIVKSPDMALEKTPGERVWMLRMANLQRNDGGNL